MSDPICFPSTNSHSQLNPDTYREMYATSLKDPKAFWATQAARLDWFKPWDEVCDTSFHQPIRVNWFKNAEINVAYNCIDRHLALHREKIAYIWVPENAKENTQKITYGELYNEVCRWSSMLHEHGVKKGDRVTIYLPMIPAAVYAMLACARIGAVHSVIFAGFSPNSILDRIEDCQSEFVITADEGWRGGKTTPLKANVDLALKSTKRVKKVFVVERTGCPIEWMSGRDVKVSTELQNASKDFPPTIMNSEDPLFILYTSGSTSKPKGVLHTSGGYLLYASLSFSTVFDYKPSQIFWCAADIGWVTGHSYIVYGPLSNAATQILYEGLPTYPTSSRLWEIIDDHKVNILYTSPTLIRSLMREGEAPVKKTSRQSLKVLGSVGEPINPEAWLWYHKVCGDERCPIVDTWWQTETGGMMITPIAGLSDLKPGSAGQAFFGIEPAILDNAGNELAGACEGQLVNKSSWPGQMRGVYGDTERFYKTYFSQYDGYYYTGDGCKRDADGFYWITGRIDDVLNVSGHRLGTAEIESALVGHHHVAEAAVVGFPHELKGQGIYAFVTPLAGVEPTDSLRATLIEQVKKELSPIAKPDFIQWAPALPKTRSGKIMRRILRKIAENDFTNLGDTTTLADPSVVASLVDGRLNKL